MLMLTSTTFFTISAAMVLVGSIIALEVAACSKDATVRSMVMTEADTQNRFDLKMAEEGNPSSDVGHMNPSEGQSEPGSGDVSELAETGKHMPNPSSQGHPVLWMTYLDPTYGFRIDYPNRFVVQPQNVAKLAKFTPTPITSIFFMNPIMASGSLAGIEPPDLELRVYHVDEVDSLESWLVSAGVASPDSGIIARPYRQAVVTGLEICQSTMIAPGCSVYFLRGNHVYQLTAMSQEGEAMIKTFTLAPYP
jgi:hypothetical protein